jgi:hypothetical protein
MNKRVEPTLEEITKALRVNFDNPRALSPKSYRVFNYIDDPSYVQGGNGSITATFQPKMFANGLNRTLQNEDIETALIAEEDRKREEVTHRLSRAHLQTLSAKRTASELESGSESISESAMPAQKNELALCPVKGKRVPLRFMTGGLKIQ